MYLLLLTTITFFSSLHNMEINTKNQCWSKELVCLAHKFISPRPYQSENVITYSKIIDFAEQIKNGKLMSKLIHNCLPSDIVKTYISPVLIQYIMNRYNYSHRIIKHKSFIPEKIFLYDPWDYMTQHDGTYYTVPKIDQNYIMWREYNASRRNVIPHNHKKYITQLSPCKNKESIFKLATLKTNDPNEQYKHYILMKASNTKLTSLKYDVLELEMSHSLSHCLCSNDNTLIAFGMSESPDQGYLFIHDIATCTNEKYILGGPISTLCAAHHSPRFALGINTSQNDRFVFSIFSKTTDKRIFEKISINDSNAITHLEFNPDDSQLLICSYNEPKNTSEIKLYNTKDPHDTQEIKSIIYEQCHIHKAFFICNGKKIMTIDKEGLFNIAQADQLLNPYIYMHNGLRPIVYLEETTDQKKIPLIIWSNKYDIVIISRGNIIEIYPAALDNTLNIIRTTNTIKAIGLTADETRIIFVSDDESVYEIPMYTAQDCNEINFIEKEMNIVNLYELFTMCKREKKSFKFFTKIQAYIQEQQKINSLKNSQL
jgi:hypothetical protein